jgi:DNA transformation protein and related proteins
VRESSEQIASIMESLAALGTVTTRSIFGGAGIFVDGRLVGVLIDETLYLHADEANRDEYLVRGMKQFTPYPNVFNLQTDHFQVPADVLADPGVLCDWGRRSLAASIASAKAKQLAGIERSRQERKEQRKKKV